MSETNPDGPFSGRDAVFTASPRDPSVFDEGDLYSLIVGAAVTDLRGGAGEDTDIVIELSDRRRLIVPSGRTGAHLQYDAPDSSNWDVPIPLVIESVKDRGLGH